MNLTSDTQNNPGVDPGADGGNNRIKKVGAKGTTTVKGYRAGHGWDPCTGFGTPNGKNLMRALHGI
jgi:hypothetical protein